MTDLIYPLNEYLGQKEKDLALLDQLPREASKARPHPAGQYS